MSTSVGGQSHCRGAIFSLIVWSQVTKKEAGSNCSVLGVTWAGWRGGLAEQGAFILMWLIAK